MKRTAHTHTHIVYTHTKALLTLWFYILRQSWQVPSIYVDCAGQYDQLESYLLIVNMTFFMQMVGKVLQARKNQVYTV